MSALTIQIQSAFAAATGVANIDVQDVDTRGPNVLTAMATDGIAGLRNVGMKSLCTQFGQCHVRMSERTAGVEKKDR